VRYINDGCGCVLTEGDKRENNGPRDKCNDKKQNKTKQTKTKEFKRTNPQGWEIFVTFFAVTGRHEYLQPEEAMTYVTTNSQ